MTLRSSIAVLALALSTGCATNSSTKRAEGYIDEGSVGVSISRSYDIVDYNIGAPGHEFTKIQLLTKTDILLYNMFTGEAHRLSRSAEERRASNNLPKVPSSALNQEDLGLIQRELIKDNPEAFGLYMTKHYGPMDQGAFILEEDAPLTVNMKDGRVFVVGAALKIKNEAGEMGYVFMNKGDGPVVAEVLDKDISAASLAALAQVFKGAKPDEAPSAPIRPKSGRQPGIIEL